MVVLYIYEVIHVTVIGRLVYRINDTIRIAIRIISFIQ